MINKRFLVVIFLLLCTGCWDINEPDRMDYVYALGIDQENGEVVIYMQIVSLSSLGTPDVALESENDIVIVREKGDTLTQAAHKIYQSAQQRMYLGHNTSVILTEEALKHQHLSEAIDLVNRFPETRYRMNIFATTDSLENILGVKTLFQGTPILTRITDLENIYDQSSRIQNMSLREIIIGLNEPTHEIALPTIGVVENMWQTEQDESLYMIKDLGVAIVTRDDFKGFILEDDSKGVRWTKEAPRSNVTIFNNQDETVGDLIVIKPEHKYSFDKHGSSIKFQMNVTAQAMINELLIDTTEEELIELLEKQIEDEIMHTYKEALDKQNDIYRLSEVVYRRDFKTWKKLQKNGVLPLHEDSLTVNIDIELVDSRIDKTRPTID